MKKLLLLIGTIIYAIPSLSQSCILIGDSVELFKKYLNKRGDVIYGTSREDGLPITIFGEDNSVYGYYVELEIKTMKKNRAYVKFVPVGSYPETIANISCAWIKKTNIGICLKQDHSNKELDDSHIMIYKKPDRQSPHQILFIDPYSYVANVSKIHKSWIKILLEVNNKYIEGWIAPENQCTEVFNRCLGN